MPEDLVAVDDLAGGVDRDQPVGVAVEGEPDVGAARARPPRRATPGAVAPEPTLMFTPSGSLWMTSTVAPVAARISGPTIAAGAVRAVEDDPQAAAVDRRRRAPAGASR